MCYQTRQIRTVKDLELRFNVGLLNEEYRAIFNEPSFHINGFSHPNMLIIPQERETTLVSGVWGIAPSHLSAKGIQDYYKKSIKYGSGLNARSEKLFEHFIYKNSIQTKRCIIPVTGFYEPHEKNKKKYPYFIHRYDDDIFALAGIYTRIENIITFTILTKPASPYFEVIHNKRKRQPVILNENNEKQWLNINTSTQEILTIIATDYPVDQLESYTISRDLYNRTIDSNTEDIHKKVDYPELNSLFN